MQKTHSRSGNSSLVLRPHPRGRPIDPPPPQIEHVEKEKKYKGKENGYRKDESLLDFQVRCNIRTTGWWTIGAVRHDPDLLASWEAPKSIKFQNFTVKHNNATTKQS